MSISLFVNLNPEYITESTISLAALGVALSRLRKLTNAIIFMARLESWIDILTEKTDRKTGGKTMQNNKCHYFHSHVELPDQTQQDLQKYGKKE